METRERNSINYNNNPPQSNQQSSPSNTTTNHETLNHLHYHQSNLQKQQTPKTIPDPDPSSQPPTSTTTRPAAAPVVRYHECLKNHAANMCAHILDGCGEFMPSGEDNTPLALKCAACDCHRSFHRRQVEGEPSQIPNPPPRVATVHLPPAPPRHQHHRHHHHPMPPIMMAFGGAAAESSSEDLNVFRTYGGLGQTSKKRFRTKFTEEQKGKMNDFAERIGWKMQKQDEQEVLQFCNEIGLKKQVFKVWMHNNKQATKKN